MHFCPAAQLLLSTATCHSTGTYPTESRDC